MYTLGSSSLSEQVEIKSVHLMYTSGQAGHHRKTGRLHFKHICSFHMRVGWETNTGLILPSQGGCRMHDDSYNEI